MALNSSVLILAACLALAPVEDRALGDADFASQCCRSLPSLVATSNVLDDFGPAPALDFLRSGSLRPRWRDGSPGVLPSLAGTHRGDAGCGNGVSSRDALERLTPSSCFSHRASGLVGELGVATTIAIEDVEAVLDVLRDGDGFEVLEPVVGLQTVDVVDDEPRGNRSVEGSPHEAVNALGGSLTSHRETDLQISITREDLTHNVTCFRSRGRSVAPNATAIACRVEAFKAWDRVPLFFVHAKECNTLQKDAHGFE